MTEMTNALINQFNGGDHDGAIQAAVAAIDAQPNDPSGYATLATMLISVRALSEARELLVKALALFPAAPALVYNRGLLAYTEGNDEVAARDFQAVLNAETFASDAAYMLGLIYRRLDAPERALAFALTAHEKAPEQVDAALLSGQLLLGMGAFTDVIKLLQPYLSRGDAQVLFTYGMAVAGTGKDGQRWLTKAEKLAPATFKQDASQVREIAGFLTAHKAVPHDGK